MAIIDESKGKLDTKDIQKNIKGLGETMKAFREANFKAIEEKEREIKGLRKLKNKEISEAQKAMKEQKEWLKQRGRLNEDTLAQLQKEYDEHMVFLDKKYNREENEQKKQLKRLNNNSKLELKRAELMGKQKKEEEKRLKAIEAHNLETDAIRENYYAEWGSVIGTMTRGADAFWDQMDASSKVVDKFNKSVLKGVEGILAVTMGSKKAAAFSAKAKEKSLEAKGFVKDKGKELKDAAAKPITTMVDMMKGIFMGAFMFIAIKKIGEFLNSKEFVEISNWIEKKIKPALIAIWEEFGIWSLLIPTIAYYLGGPMIKGVKAMIVVAKIFGKVMGAVIPEKFKEKIKDVIQNMKGGIGKQWQKIRITAKKFKRFMKTKFIPNLIDGMKSTMNSMKDKVISGIKWVVDTAKKFKTFMMTTFIPNLIDGMKSTMNSMKGKVIDGIKWVVDMAKAFKVFMMTTFIPNLIDGMKSTMDSMKGKVISGIKWLVNIAKAFKVFMMTTFLPGMLSGFTGMMSSLVGVLSGFMATLTPILIAAAPFIAIGLAIAAVLYALYESFEKAKSTFEETGSITETIKVFIIHFLTAPYRWIKNLVAWVLEKFGFSDTAKELNDFDLTQWVSDIVDKIWNWLYDMTIGNIMKLFDSDSSSGDIMAALIDLMTFIPNLLKDWLWMPILEFFGMDTSKGLGKDLKDLSIGELFVKYVWDPIVDMFTFKGKSNFSLSKWIDGIFKDVVKWFGDLFGFDTSGMDDFSLSDWIDEKFRDIVKAVGEFFGFDTSAITLDFSIIDWISDTISGLWDTIRGYFGYGPKAIKGDASFMERVGMMLSDFFSGIFYTILTFLGEKLGSFGGKQILEFAEDFKPKKREAGGSIAGGELVMVGERGPELMVAGQPGTVHTAQRTQSMLDGALNRKVETQQATAAAPAINNIITDNSTQSSAGFISPVEMIINDKLFRAAHSYTC